MQVHMTRSSCGEPGAGTSTKLLPRAGAEIRPRSSVYAREDGSAVHQPQKTARTRGAPDAAAPHSDDNSAPRSERPL